MQRLSNSWSLVKASWAVLRADKELIIFPILAFAGSIVVMITFFVPMALTGIFNSLSDGRGTQAGLYVFVFLFYLVQYTVVIFSNSALVGAATIRLKGGDPTVRDGLRIASQHFGA
ncbi:MAG: hypothetical protein KA765_14275, partial [Thermoflexales bacterium]|nr:hypothetical protein [Thermoflexales bacterium]